MRFLRSGTLWFSLLTGMIASGQASAAALASVSDSTYSTTLIDLPAMRVETNGSGLAGHGSLKLSLDADPDANEDRDWQGLKQDTLYFAVAQVAVIGVLYVSPESISRWSAEDKEQYDFQKWKENVSNPVWDTDQWWINYIMHPYWGGAYYVRASERGYGPTPSFWYSAMLSTMYEFGAEALFEPVSVQDLIFTPGLGFFVGRYFMSVREGIEGREMNGEALSGTDRATLVMTDPLGAVSRGINNMLGREVSFTLSPAVMVAESVSYPDGDTSVTGRPAGEVYSGLRMRLTW